MRECLIALEIIKKANGVKDYYGLLAGTINIFDMLDNLPNGFIFVNYTKVSGNYKDIYVEDKDDWTTITYYKEIETTQKLPRTGC